MTTSLQRSVPAAIVPSHADIVVIGAGFGGMSAIAEGGVAVITTAAERLTGQGAGAAARAGTPMESVG